MIAKVAEASSFGELRKRRTPEQDAPATIL